MVKIGKYFFKASCLEFLIKLSYFKFNVELLRFRLNIKISYFEFDIKLPSYKFNDIYADDIKLLDIFFSERKSFKEIKGKKIISEHF